MERLWVPWRMEYIEQIDKEANNCIFCSKCRQELDEGNLVLYRGEWVFLLLNTFPYTNGHLLVAPYRHTADVVDLDPDEAREMMEITALGVKLLKLTMRPDGFNIGMNLGRPAGAGIADHLHLHIVPRWSGDTNFMSVCGDVKVIPEALSDTWKKLQNALEAEKKRDAS